MHSRTSAGQGTLNEGGHIQFLTPLIGAKPIRLLNYRFVLDTQLICNHCDKLTIRRLGPAHIDRVAE